MSYRELPRQPAGAEEVFLAFPRGLQATASIVFFIFLIGGTFGVLQATGALEAGIGAIVSGARGRAELVLRFSSSSSQSGAARSAWRKRRCRSCPAW